MNESSVTATAIFIGILSVLVIFYIRLGKFGFWQLASEIPEIFIEYAFNDDVWIVSEIPIDKPTQDYVGPFKFIAFGTTFTLYAKTESIEQSQAQFIERYGELIPKKSFPYPSLIALSYPILSMLTYPKASILMILGYGFSNLGYLLLAAVIPGTFRILGFNYRIQIFVTAVIFWIVGFFLTNVAL